MRVALTLAVFALDVWAITAILSTTLRSRANFAWIVVVAALPLAGVIAWKFAGPKAFSAPVKT